MTEVPLGMKACAICCEYKPLTAYGRKANRLNSCCKPCRATKELARYHAKASQPPPLWPRPDAAIDRAFNAWRHAVEPGQLTWRLA